MIRTKSFIALIYLICLLSSCGSSPFESGVRQVLLQIDSTCEQIQRISVIESMSQLEARLYFEKRIQEIKAKMEYQFKAIGSEPCLCSVNDSVKAFYIEDLEWMEKLIKVDSSQKERLLQKNLFYLPGQSRLFCFHVLYRQRALLRSLKEVMEKNPNPIIEDLAAQINKGTSFKLIKVRYRPANDSIKSKSFFVTLSASDTLYIPRENSLAEILRPVDYGFPKLEALEGDQPTGQDQSRCGGVEDFFIGKVMGGKIEWPAITLVDKLERSVEKSTYTAFDCYVDTTQISASPDRPINYLYLYNQTDSTLLLDRYLTFYLEAKDRMGKWKPLQSNLTMSYDPSPYRKVSEHHFAVAPLLETKGDFKTEFRVVVFNFNSISYTYPFQGYTSDSLFEFPNKKDWHTNIYRGYQNDFEVFLNQINF